MAVAIAVAVPIMLPPIAVPVPIPAVIMFETAAVAFPVAVKKTLPIVTGCDPARTPVGRTRPVSVMPPITAACRIPITIHPKKNPARAPTAALEPPEEEAVAQY